MKTFNKKLILSIITSLILTGCMPDSLTKFKKDEPKKAETTDGTTPPIVDDNGNVVDPSTIVYPTKFYFISEGATPTQYLKVNQAVELQPIADGSLGDPAQEKLIFIKCELVQTGPAITRVLPPGLAFSQSDCNIKGTPLSIFTDTTPGNIGQPIEYTVRLIYRGEDYRGVGTESSKLASIKLGVYDLPTSLSMSQNDRLQIKLSPKSGSFNNIQSNSNPADLYKRYGVLTSNTGVAGIVKYTEPSSSTLGLYKLQPIVVSSTIAFQVEDYISTNGNAKVGKILAVNTATKTLYVEALTSNTVFAANDAIDDSDNFAGAEATVVTAAPSSYTLPVGAKIDNDTQYFSNKFDIQSVTQTYPRGTTIPPIVPLESETISAANGISYSISPSLPAGLLFSPSTGMISGSFSATLESTSFLVVATNPLGSASYTLNLAAIDAPLDLSYTTRQLISVNSYSLFLEGESIFQQIQTPLLPVKGRILRKISPNRLSIENLNGDFLSENKIDSGNAYYSEKSSVVLNSAPNYYDIALTVTSAASFSAGSYVTSSNNARGRVIYSDTVNNVLYIQFLTPTVISPTPAGSIIKNFRQLDTIGAGNSILQVEASAVSLTLPTTAGFDPGHDITTPTLSGYIYDWDTGNNIVKVNEINRTGAGDSFKIGQSVNFSEYYANIGVNISGVENDNLIVIERGVPRTIFANVSQGTSVIYSISPSLPTGLTLDPNKGTISGTSTAMSLRRPYVVTATNLLGKAYYGFDLEVRDFFTFGETSGAKSFLTHKIGQNRASRDCRINAADIINANGSLDLTNIGCNIEAEEMELYYNRLKLSASVGGGVCEFIRFRPFSFWQYPAHKTKRIKLFKSGCTGGNSTGASTTQPTAVNSCLGNYTNDGGPNCDEGTVTVKTFTASEAGNACDLESTTTINCGGTRTACLAGPVTSVITPDRLAMGVRSEAVASASGLTKTWEIKSPMDFLDTTNLRNANGNGGNNCSDTRADATKWVNVQKTIDRTINPFAQESPYYEFACLDNAQDVKALIRVNVRDWDRTFRINNLISDLAPAILMNDNTINAAIGVGYNNKMDWDNGYAPDGAQIFKDAAVCEDVAAPDYRCTDISKVDKATCETDDETWYPVPYTAECTDNTKLTKATCEAASGIWFVPDFAFPGADI